jgi:parallel beta-helix repeat protein
MYIKLARMSLLTGVMFAFAGCGEPTTPSLDQVPSSLDKVTEESAIPVSECGTTITGPGNYVLVKDLFNCQVYSVRVAGRLGAPVTLRLNNHRIAWTANPVETPVGTTALDIGSYATVLGPGVVEGYWANIGLNGVQSVLRGVTATNPHSWNLLAAGQHLLIQGNTFRGGPVAGVQVDGSSDLVLAGNHFRPAPHGNLADPALLLRSTGVEVRENDFREVLTGIIAQGGGNHRIVHNVFSNTLNAGIHLQWSNGNQILRNVMRTNHQWGILLWGGGSNTIRDNTVTDGGTGISLESGTAGNIIQGNYVVNNSGLDLGEEAGRCDLDTWLNNTFITAWPLCIQ